MEKFEYIDKVIKFRENKKSENKQTNLNSDITFYNINKDTLKILKSNLKKYEKENPTKDYIKTKKKIKAMYIYLNLAFFALSLKYIEIVIKVKNGGIIF